jgi:hypothetical protein
VWLTPSNTRPRTTNGTLAISDGESTTIDAPH